jgi:Putative amidoligase enzyme
MPSTFSSRVRQEQAYNLRQQGFTYQQIADRLGYAGGSAACQAVRAAERRGYRGTTISVPTAAASNATPSGRTFGVEIEFSSLSGHAAVQAINDAGLACTYEGYTHRVLGDWKVVSDSTCGYEAVSPILFGEDGYEQVRKVVAALSAAGATVNTRCGLHVHHGADDLNGEQLASLFELYASHFNAIDHLVAPSRRQNRNRWCKRFKRGELSKIVDGLRSRRDDVRSGAFGTWNMLSARDDRYRHINLCSFPKYGTIEIRQHQGTLNGDKAVAWIKFGQALVQAAIDGGASRVPNTVFEMINTLRSNHGLDADTAGFLMERAMHFAEAE